VKKADYFHQKKGFIENIFNEPRLKGKPEKITSDFANYF